MLNDLNVNGTTFLNLFKMSRLLPNLIFVGLNIIKKDDPLIQQTANFISLKCPDIELFRQSKEIVAEDMRNLTC